MVDIVIILVIETLALVFLGSAFARIEKNEDLSSEKAKERNDKWHANKWMFLALMFINLSYEKYGLSLESILLWVGQFSLVPLIFNPTINLNKGNSFFYLSNEGIEGKFKEVIGEKIYYLFWVLLLTLVLIWIV